MTLLLTIHTKTSYIYFFFWGGGIRTYYCKSSYFSADCTNDAATDPCAVPIETISLGDDPHYDQYESWRVGDTHLDWFGAESGQGDHNGVPSEGTPMAWTTDDNTHPGFQPDNE